MIMAAIDAIVGLEYDLALIERPRPRRVAVVVTPISPSTEEEVRRIRSDTGVTLRLQILYQRSCQVEGGRSVSFRRQQYLNSVAASAMAPAETARGCERGSEAAARPSLDLFLQLGLLLRLGFRAI